MSTCARSNMCYFASAKVQSDCTQLVQLHSVGIIPTKGCHGCLQSSPCSAIWNSTVPGFILFKPNFTTRWTCEPTYANNPWDSVVLFCLQHVSVPGFGLESEDRSEGPGRGDQRRRTHRSEDRSGWSAGVTECYGMPQFVLSNLLQQTKSLRLEAFLAFEHDLYWVVYSAHAFY